MARLLLGGDDLRIHLGLFERIGAFVGGDGSVPLGAIRSVGVAEDPWRELRGMRSPGVRWSRRIALGTWRHARGKDFVALRGRRPAVVVELTGQSFARLMIATPDAARMAEEIRDAASRVPQR